MALRDTLLMDFKNLSHLLRPALASRPIVSGTLRLPGLQSPVTIRRDRYAIPYIDAATEEDAWFGLGFCQAQDRAFQLELRLRTQRGTLSEMVGEKTLPIDRLSRRIGFVESSRRQLAVLDADVRAQVEAFARGINAGLSAGMRRRPLEFKLLQAEPSIWRPEDVIGVGKLVSFLLIGNWDVELARLKILLEDGPEALRELDPVFAAYSPPDGRASGSRDHALRAGVEALSHDLSQFIEFAGAAGGSNAWVVSGARTASGRPLLANDPHLEPVLPAHWYLVNMRTPRWSVAGAALAGTPAIGIGHNGFAAWGITAGLVDTVDLFIEEVGPDGVSVKRGEAYEACRRRTEVINVKGRSAVVEEVLETPRGPVISPALHDVPLALSLRAVWLDARPARGFLRSHTARDFESFRAEFEHWPLFSQNAVYTDVTGKIAWQLVGEAPRRRKGWGTLPLHASDPETGWYDDTVPLASMPCAQDPASGYLTTANNVPHRVAQNEAPRDGAPFLGVDWLDEYRASRISAVLQTRSDWDPDATTRLQMDEETLAWPEVRDALLTAQPSTAGGRDALSLLGEWDGVLAAGSTAATVYQMLSSEMWRRIVRSRAPRSANWALGRGFTNLLGLTTFTGGRSTTLSGHLNRQTESWFSRPWVVELGDALDGVVRDLTLQFGRDQEGWAWGRVRPLTLEHPLSVVKALAPIVNRGPFPWGGDGNTISQAGSTPLKALTNPTVVASLRYVVEPGDWDNARFVLPGGQSGDPLSPHYDDLLPLWLEGGSVPIAWSEQAIARATVTTLDIQPLRLERSDGN